MADLIVQTYLENIASQNRNTGKTVTQLIREFQAFVQQRYGLTVTELILRLKAGTAIDGLPKEEQPYEILAAYARSLKAKLDSGENSARTVKFKLSWARNLLEVNFIPISKAIYKMRVKTPTPEDPEVSPIDKKTVSSIITACDDQRMLAFILWLASTGWRASESISIQNRHLEGLTITNTDGGVSVKIEANPVYVNVSGKHAKTKKGKRRALTTELTNQLKRYLEYKYRPRTIKNYTPIDPSTGKRSYTEKKIRPYSSPDDYVFLTYHDDHSPLSQHLIRNSYQFMANRFAHLIDRIGVEREESGKRRKVTLHSLRRFAFTQCQIAVSSEYAKHHIGRKIHEYTQKTPDQILEEFRRAESHLTFMDTSQIEAIAKRTDDKIAVLQAEIQKLKTVYGNPAPDRLEDLYQITLDVQAHIKHIEAGDQINSCALCCRGRGWPKPLPIEEWKLKK